MPDCVTCGDDGPVTARVMLTVGGCRKYGVKGMIALINAGDRTPDDEMIERRTKCRGCEDRVRNGGIDLCKRTRLAIHFATAVASYQCSMWDA